MLSATLKVRKINNTYSDYMHFPKNIMENALEESFGNKNTGLPTLFSISTKYKTSVFGRACDMCEDNNVGLQEWMIETLCVEEGDEVQIDKILIPKKVKTIKLKPRSKEFLNIINNIYEDSSILEEPISKYSCLGRNQVIILNLLGSDYKFEITSLLSNENKKIKCGYILNSDVNVDFDETSEYGVNFSG